LLYPDSSVADAYHYASTASEESYSRNPDGVGTFTTACAPTPNAPNSPFGPAPTTTSTFTPTFTPTVTPTTTGTPTLTSTPTNTRAAPEHLVISQIYGAGGNIGALFDHDYIEIYNAN